MRSMTKPDCRPVQVVFTVLHAGGKFENENYKISGGLHGVGASVVNALSVWLEVTVKRNGLVYEQRYERGNVVSELRVTGKCKKNETGTTVRFLPMMKFSKRPILRPV